MFRNHNDYKWSTTTETDKQQSFEPIKCTSCEDEQLYYSDTELEYHRETKHKLHCFIPPKTLCLVCAKSFKSRKSLIAHFKVQHLLSARDSKRVERDIYICDICHHIFFNRAILELHIFSRHQYIYKKNTITCSHCNRKVKKASIWNHFECYGLRRVSTCPICLSKCESRSAMFKHMESHAPNLRCNMCHYFTHKRVFYVNHLKYSHTPAQPNTDTEYKRFFVGSSKVRHWWYKIPYVTKGVRVDGAVAVCVLCREMCLNEDEMRAHISNHQPDFTLESLCKYITCDVCGERFVNKILYKYHKLKSVECKEETAAPVPESFDSVGKCEEGADDKMQVVVEVAPAGVDGVEVAPAGVDGVDSKDVGI